VEGVRVILTEGPIEPEPPRTPAGCGAATVFLGVVRGEEQGSPIDALEYTTYDPMAELVLRSLAGEALARFGVRRVDVTHSKGRVRAGECSFRLLVAGAHRREVLTATEWFIERMKEDAPIWKRPIPVSVGAGQSGGPR
jgi:molybdopterin synthase catalytic subunit